MKQAADILLPWDVTRLDVAPWPGFWGFNPSIHFDPTDGKWRAIVRQADYHAPHGIVRANMARGGKVQTRNVLAELDPVTWAPIAMAELHELDGLPRFAASSRGYEDLRLFRTEADGLCAIATTMQLRPDTKQEMAILRFGADADGAIAITSARPIRGPWGEIPQKNWAPFDGALGIRLLYSIELGTVFDEAGPIGYAAAQAAELARPPPPRPALPPQRYNGGVETKHTPRVVRAERADGTTRASASPASPRFDWNAPGLRGGSQLVSLGDDLWLGVGHEMKWLGNRSSKYYWHVFYVCDSRGRLLERTEPMKLSKCGIEFAAGLALDEAEDRLIVSFGTEDQDSWIGETRLEAVLERMVPVAAMEAACR